MSFNTFVSAQSVNHTSKVKLGSSSQAQQMVESSKRSIAQSTRWMSQEWKGNNQPFHAVTIAIEQAAASKQLAAALPRYKEQARVKPWDALTQYRYVLADLTLSMKKWPVDWNRAQQWQIDIGGVESPETVDFSRLQFLVESVYRKRPEARPLGLRLQKFYPHDLWIRHFLERYKWNSPDSKEIKGLVSQSRSKVKDKPNSLEAQADLVDSTFSLWLKTRKRSDANSAVAAYKRYLVLLPPDAPNRAKVTEYIHMIPKSQALYETKGLGKPD